MDRSQLAARIQEILKGRPSPPRPEAQAPASVAAADLGSGAGGSGDRIHLVHDEEAAFAARCAADEAGARVLDVLGATQEHGPGGPCIVVDRHHDGHRAHGRRRLSEYTAAMADAAEGFDLLLPGWSGTPLFFDLETTGLSGGAGTYAFLVGCGCFDGDGFHTRQFLLRDFGAERALLEAVTAYVQGFGTRAGTPAATSLATLQRDPRDPLGTGHPPSLAAASFGAAGSPAGTASAGPRDARDLLPTAHPPSLAVQGSYGEASCPPATVVTYNGKSFDLPLIDTRYLMHRQASPFGGLPHLDLLFPARRLWRRRLVREGSDRRVRLAGGLVSRDDDHASCALTVLEEDILGLVREDDVPGWEIPARYFAYARTGDARGLQAVLEHNRLDLVSLGALTAVVLEMVSGRAPARDRYESLALGRLFEFLGRTGDAERCYARAAEPDGLFEAALDGAARAEALRWLALHRRRARRFVEAAELWRRLVEIEGLSPEMRREGLEALAIHAEHRAKDLAAARRFALGALDLSRGGRHVPEVEHRLGRLQRKIAIHGAAPGAPSTCAPTQPSFPVEP